MCPPPRSFRLNRVCLGFRVQGVQKAYAIVDELLRAGFSRAEAARGIPRTPAACHPTRETACIEPNRLLNFSLASDHVVNAFWQSGRAEGEDVRVRRGVHADSECAFRVGVSPKEGGPLPCEGERSPVPVRGGWPV